METMGAERAEGNIALNVQIQHAGYEEGKPIVHDVAFDVRQGELVALIGPNGAGKSTTVKGVIGMLRHMSGKVKIGNGEGRYAYVPEQPVLYDYMTLWEHLRLAASVFHLAEAEFEERAERLLERFRMSGVRHNLPSSFSKGMQQKTMLIIGFMLQPDVYIVDEPFVGLDPRATMEFLELLESERQRGAGILMSTHVLDTAERIGERFVLIDNGTVVASGTLADIRMQSGGGPEDTLFACFSRLT
ncbi:ABC transporter related protein [Paenibacillus curdlanolyticus YK9]|uniref:ABC transporter related protein n=1 Tax=Paenibacillus curdlanolyticus YK9 TaxID=717606 RepID=E0I7L3_9BACL|nr:ABC transporter ATP-binding protein [Paenibacillus curdlanolyticus]EFM11168.1 ABC transporter related protein [Paenibacillus curdlanolyticus YK9]